jgi:hypothetical protein
MIIFQLRVIYAAAICGFKSIASPNLLPKAYTPLYISMYLCMYICIYISSEYVEKTGFQQTTFPILLSFATSYFID